MNALGTAIVALVALEHAWFFVLESFLFTAPIGLQTFHNTPERAATLAVLAKNQGVYNAFLAAGLVWSLVHPDPSVAFQLRAFFLGCVFVAGIVGGATLSFPVFLLQGMPALVGLGVAWLAWPR